MKLTNEQIDLALKNGIIAYVNDWEYCVTKNYFKPNFGYWKKDEQGNRTYFPILWVPDENGQIIIFLDEDYKKRWWIV